MRVDVLVHLYVKVDVSGSLQSLTNVFIEARALD